MLLGTVLLAIGLLQVMESPGLGGTLAVLGIGMGLAGLVMNHQDHTR